MPDNALPAKTRGQKNEPSRTRDRYREDLEVTAATIIDIPAPPQSSHSRPSSGESAELGWGGQRRLAHDRARRGDGTSRTDRAQCVEQGGASPAELHVEEG